MAQRGAADNQVKPGRAASTINNGVLRLIDGVWYLDTDTSATPDGYLVEAGGGPAVDDAASSGQRVVRGPRSILSY